MKRTIATILAVMLVAAMLVLPTAAANDYSITITNTSASHSFTAYQIFTGDLAAGVLSNVVWGDGIDGAGLLADLKASSSTHFVKNGANIFDTCADAEDLAKVLETNVTTVEATDEFARVVAENLTGTGKTGTAVGTECTIADLAAGYYIVIDNATLDAGDALSKYMVQLSSNDPNVKVSVKKDAPTMSKTVSRSLNLTYTEAISASYNDTVYFKLEGKMHTRLSDYGKYFYKIVDTLPEGMTFKQIESVEIVNDTKSNAVDASEYSVSVVGNVITIIFDDIKTSIKNATGIDAVADDTVVIKYSATMNDGFVGDTSEANTAANIGKPGNENNVVLSYSCDPNGSYLTTASTKVDTAYVYSYQVVIEKVDGSNTATKLPGAQFTLHRLIDRTEYAIVDANGRLTGWTESAADASKLTTDANGNVSIIGLSSGTYYLKEFKAPESYNRLEDTISVTITASANATSGELENLTASTTHGGSAATVLNDGKITVTIGNNKGATLPTTGGMGTTIFYILGGVLVIGAAAVLFTKKRSAEK